MVRQSGGPRLRDIRRQLLLESALLAAAGGLVGVVAGAVGALRRDILGQFLTEAVTLSSLGGVIGVALGLAAAAGERATVPSLPTDVPLWSPLVGLGVR